MRITKRLLVPANLLLILLTVVVLLTMSCSGASTTTSTTTSSTTTSTPTTPAATQASTSTTPPTSAVATSTTSTVKPTSTLPTSSTAATSTTSTVKPTSTTTTAAAAPTGVLRVAMPGLEDETFLPWNGAAGRKFYLDTIYEYLIYMDPVTRLPVPGLATSWSNSPDGKTWTVNLRQGVQFQENYGELTSADVKFTFERQMAPSSKASQASNFRDFNLTVSTPDKYTAVFNINKPDFTFWNRLGNNVGNSIVCKKYIEQVGDEKANSHPIGTGAFTLGELKRGIMIKVTAVPGAQNHWRVKPAFKDIAFYSVPEESTRVAMLLSGEADMGPINLDSIDNFKRQNFKILSQKDTWGSRLVMGGLVQTDPARYNPSAPWAKLEVRQALNYAIDKEAIARNILKGAARANFDPHSFEDRPAAAYPYDVNKAKQLLASAGYPKGFSITLYTCPRNPGAQLPDIGMAAATYWEAIGINVKIVPTDYPTIRAAWTGGKAMTMFWTHTYSPPVSLDDAMGFSAANIAASVFAIYTTPELDQMVNAAMAEPDPAKRTTLVATANDYLTKQADFIYLLSAEEPFAASAIIASWPTIINYPSNFDQVTKTK